MAETEQVKPALRPITLDDLTVTFNQVAALGDTKRLAEYIHSIDLTALTDEAFDDELERRRLVDAHYGGETDPLLTGGVDWARMLQEAEAELARRQALLPPPEVKE